MNYLMNKDKKRGRIYLFVVVVVVVVFILLIPVFVLLRKKRINCVLKYFKKKERVKKSSFPLSIQFNSIFFIYFSHLIIYT
jgi:hypothetical protein